jgi:nitrogen fixation protein
MKKFKVTGKDNSITVYVSEEDLSEKIKDWGHGKPERVVLHKDEQGAEPYDEADVLEEILVESTDLPPQKMVKLKAEYTIEIEDITAEHELGECIRKRKAEYPSAEEFLNAFFDGGDEAVAELQAKRLAIKAKYPKP